MSLSCATLNMHGRTQDKATLEPEGGVVVGNIPSWLNGELVRNGPGIQDVGNERYNNLFDGLSVLHKFSIRNGQVIGRAVFDKVSYISRPLESDAYKENTGAKRIMVTELGTVGFSDPCESVFQRFKSSFKALSDPEAGMTDNCNVNIGVFGDEVYALTETNYIRRIDPETLETLKGKTCLRDYIAINHASAHPHYLADGTTINMGNSYMHKRGPHYCVIKFPPNRGLEDTKSSLERAKIIAEIPLTNKLKPSYYHSFGLTENYIVFMEGPLQIDVMKMMKLKLLRKPIVGAVKWNKKMMTRFHIVSLKTGQAHPVTYLAEPVFAFHHVNAFEDKGHIVVDVSGYGNDKLMKTMSRAKDEEILAFTDLDGAAVRRYCLPLDLKNAVAGQNLVRLADILACSFLDTTSSKSKPRVLCHPEFLTRTCVDLPRINYAFNGKKYNYFYGLSQKSQAPAKDVPVEFQIAKVNVSDEKMLIWREDDVMPGEPVFIPNPEANIEDEDNGVVVSSLLHLKDTRMTTLLVLNGKNMKEMGRATFKTDGVAVGAFHGQWLGL